MALFTFTSSICVHDFNHMFTPTIRYEVEFILYFPQRANSGKVSVSTTALKRKIIDIVTMESKKFLPTLEDPDTSSGCMYHINSLHVYSILF